MASFIGRSGYHLFFTEGDNGVVVDSRVAVVVASGAASTLDASQEWAGGEFTELDEQSASTALASMDRTEAEPTARLYTIPLGAQKAARRGLQEFADGAKGGSPAALAIARTLIAGGQIDFHSLALISDYFENNAITADASGELPLTHKLYGGSAAQKWATAIVSREPRDTVKPAVGWDELQDIIADDPEAGPEFIARVMLDGSGIDRLYRVDLDGQTLVWDAGTWTNLGLPNGDIWMYDLRMDDPAYNGETFEATHVLIDPDSAITIAQLLTDDPFQNVYIEDLEPVEHKLAIDSLPEIDFELLDSTITAAGGTPGDGIYSPDERSENAGQQVRDGNGKFAKQGQRVMINSDPSVTGKITRVDKATGNVEVSLESGGSTVVSGKSVEGVGAYTATIPGRPVEVPRVDFSGILAEPRTPINRNIAQIPGTLPQMTPRDLHAVINNFPAWVKSQRDQFLSLGGPVQRGVQGKDSLDTGSKGAEIEKSTGSKIEFDAYNNSLLNDWLKKKDSDGYDSNSIWYDPITAAGEIGNGELNPDNSDVPPIYLAIVSPDDPRAVLKLVSLVPATADSTSPMTYKREDGEWSRDPQTLNTLNSATPPPIVPLDETTLNDCLKQVDAAQGVDNEATDDNQFLGESDVPGATPTDVPAPTDPAEAAPVASDEAPVTEAAPVVASAETTLMVLWGPRKEIMQSALVAAGGADRNRGGAEKLRKYWTKGPGAAKIRWGTPGDWTRCVRQLGKYLGPRAKGYCALRHKEMTGMWTGDKANRQVFSVNTGGKVYSDAMVASTDQVMNAAKLRIRAEFARQAMKGITASADPKYKVYDTETQQGLTAAAMAVQYTEPTGGAFFIPLALPEGIESGDGRLVEKYATTIRDLPISLLWQINTDEGHKGAVVVGRIEKLGRTPKGIGAGYGHFDTGIYGAEAERMVRAGMLRFVSADMDNFEADAAPEEELAEGEHEKTVSKKRLNIDTARVMAVTIVAKPAFQEATIQIVPDAIPEEENMIPDGIYVDGNDPLEEAALVAAGYVADSIPLAPPTTWFEDPKLQGPTPLTIDDSGRVFGHIAAWDVDHIGMAFGTKPPRSRSNYGYFHKGLLRTEEGTDVPVGQLTLAGGHAGLEFSARDAIKHYDDTASAVADVHAGEDKFGIWVAGSVRPGTRPEQVRALRASAPSGDWRPIRGKLELVAVCQVNVPGFPIARTMVASGQVLSLVAAGAMSLAKMKSDPVTELAARLENLEKVANRELALRASAAREKIAPARAKRDHELSAKREEVRARMASFGHAAPTKREGASDQGQTLSDDTFLD
jgi:hypothetical protein